MNQFTHVDAKGQLNMVDVSEKAITTRTAIAQGYVYMSEDTIAQIVEHSNKKGDVLTTAKIAGIQAAKRCADLIPLCHPLALTKVDVDAEVESEHGRVKVQALCRVNGNTGVEMEALTAVSVATLTLFDMCKASDPFMTISDIQVVEKRGGKSGHWHRFEDEKGEE